MNKIKYIIVFSLIISTFSCSDEFLETKDRYSVSSDTYYRTPKDMQEALTGAYSVLPIEKGETSHILTAMVLSDDVLGGGDGGGDVWIRNVDQFADAAKEDLFEPMWRRYYEGIFRVNSIIDNFGNAEYESQVDADRDLGEAYFLRSFFYFQLSKFFGTVPLIITPLSGNEPRAEVDVLFAQIAYDMKKAIELLPATNYSALDPNRDGHATKWAAEAIMARIYLFYTGTYGKSELPVTEGNPIAKTEVVGYLNDVVGNSGHKMVDNFPELWAYSATGLKKDVALWLKHPDSTKTTFVDSVPANSFVHDNGYEWVDDTGKNTETIFKFKFNTFGDHQGADMPRANHMVLFCGIRDSKGVPHGSGWGFCTVHPDLWNSYEAEDTIRKYGSMFNIEDERSEYYEGITVQKIQASKPTYSGFNVTGVFNKKWMPLYDQGEKYKNLTALWVLRGYTFEDGMQFSHMRDLPIVRMADVWLMLSELNENAEGINMVRDRAGLEDVAWSMENLIRERRHELAFEGQRYFDLMRWGKLQEAFDNSSAIKVADGAFNEDGSYPNDYKMSTYRADRRFVPIPESQILLSAGVLEQNEGWK